MSTDHFYSYRNHLLHLLRQEHEEHQRRIEPIVKELIRLENMRIEPWIMMNPSELTIKKAPASEDRGQGGQETTTKNEPSV